MRKLKLEALHVESFETTPAAPRMRGTIQANGDAPGTTVDPGTAVSQCARCPWTVGGGCGPATYNAVECGETQYFDCSLGCTNACTDKNSCNVCWIEYTDGCPRETP